MGDRVKGGGRRREVRPTSEPRQERSADTRRRLLDATVELLATSGYGTTTTTAVGERAGTSRGALLHHFPTRAQLVSAAVGQLFAELRRQYEQAFADVPANGNRVAAAVDLLWTTFQDPRLMAVLDLWLAARGDEDLRSRLLAVSREHYDHVRNLAGELMPEARRHPRFEPFVTLLFDTLQGCAVRKLARPDDPDIKSTVDLARDLAVTALEARERELE